MDVVVEKDGQAARIAKDDDGFIAEVTECLITLHFGKFGVHSWDLEEFPFRVSP